MPLQFERAGRSLQRAEPHPPRNLDTHLAHMAHTWITAHGRGDTVALVASSNDHADTINRAVQHARLDAGLVDPDTARRIAGGEHAHVGDVVATRRNDRRLLTSSGEAVRNRDTWTVTGIAADGSITVSHQGGHGVVTLPTDYVTEHVRLGYAATEHGYQSDTVTTAIALASTATTRRGLYVAATRGRDSNEICVITDSNDPADARDVRDAIVAVDRADIPAVTQRRTLAQQQRGHHVPTPARVTPRCAIPEWFGTLLHDARRELAAAEQRRAARATGRQRLQDAAVAADRVVHDVAAATAPDRDTYAHAAARADTARRDHAAAQRRLAVSHAEAAAAHATTWRSSSAAWNAPTPTSNAPKTEPNRPSIATAKPRPSSGKSTTTCATTTPPTCSTTSTTHSPPTGRESPPSKPGTGGPPATMSRTTTYKRPTRR